MKVLGNRILVEQVMTRKSTLIQANIKKDAEENFDIKRVVLQVGPDVPPGTIEVGDIPIFGKYAEPTSVKIFEKSDQVVKALLVMEYENIVAIDDDIK